MSISTERTRPLRRDMHKRTKATYKVTSPSTTVTDEYKLFLLYEASITTNPPSITEETILTFLNTPWDDSSEDPCAILSTPEPAAHDEPRVKRQENLKSTHPPIVLASSSPILTTPTQRAIDESSISALKGENPSDAKLMPNIHEVIHDLPSRPPSRMSFFDDDSDSDEDSDDITFQAKKATRPSFYKQPTRNTSSVNLLNCVAEEEEEEETEESNTTPHPSLREVYSTTRDNTSEKKTPSSPKKVVVSVTPSLPVIEEEDEDEGCAKRGANAAPVKSFHHITSPVVFVTSPSLDSINGHAIEVLVAGDINIAPPATNILESEAGELTNTNSEEPETFSIPSSPAFWTLDDADESLSTEGSSSLTRSVQRTATNDTTDTSFEHLLGPKVFDDILFDSDSDSFSDDSFSIDGSIRNFDDRFRIPSSPGGSDSVSQLSYAGIDLASVDTKELFFSTAWKRDEASGRYIFNVAEADDMLGTPALLISSPTVPTVEPSPAEDSEALAPFKDDLAHEKHGLLQVPGTPVHDKSIGQATEDITSTEFDHDDDEDTGDYVPETIYALYHENPSCADLSAMIHSDRPSTSDVEVTPLQVTIPAAVPVIPPVAISATTPAAIRLANTLANADNDSDLGESQPKLAKIGNFFKRQARYFKPRYNKRARNEGLPPVSGEESQSTSSSGHRVPFAKVFDHIKHSAKKFNSRKSSQKFAQNNGPAGTWL